VRPHNSQPDPPCCDKPHSSSQVRGAIPSFGRRLASVKRSENSRLLHATRSDIEETCEGLSRLVFEKLRSHRWRVLRAKPIFWTIWDSFSGSCSTAAARQSFLQFSVSSVKQEFIKTPLRPDSYLTLPHPQTQSSGQSIS